MDLIDEYDDLDEQLKDKLEECNYEKYAFEIARNNTISELRTMEEKLQLMKDVSKTKII